MRRTVVALLLLCPRVTEAQDLRESWTVGVSGAAGFPAALGALRFGEPLGPKAGVDLLVGRFAGAGGDVPGDGFGRVYMGQVRWIRGGRKANGGSRSWIFGALAMHGHFSTEVRYPGGIVKYLVDDQTFVAPRVGYGVDRVTRAGVRVGAELTTGAANEAPFVFAGIFLMWGQPRR